jgi:hypothetical protein
VDERLRERLAKLEALFARAGTAGERAAAGAAIARLQGKAGGPRPVELKFSLPDPWSVRLFVAVCRKHGLRPYRYSRQRRTTVMVRVHERAFDRLVWPEFSHLQTALELYFEETVDHLITEAMHSDGDDSTLEALEIGR